MPGDSNIGDYTTKQLMEMSREEFLAAEARGWKVPSAGEFSPGLLDGIPERPAAAGVAVRAAPEPADDVWARARGERGRDFVCPSGQRCRLVDVAPDRLLAAGILDKVTRLEGLAQDLIDRAEGKPPEKLQEPSREDLEAMVEVINVIVPLAVVKPSVFADDDPQAGSDDIRVSDIDFGDRVAILNEALKGLKALDRFRNAG